MYELLQIMELLSFYFMTRRFLSITKTPMFFCRIGIKSYMSSIVSILEIHHCPTPKSDVETAKLPKYQDRRMG